MKLLWKLMLGRVAALPVFDYLVLLGSSTTAYTYTLNPQAGTGRQEQNARAAFAAAGIELPVISKAVAGSTIANLDTNVTSYLTDFGLTGKRVGVLIHIGANDIGQTSYAAMAQGTKDAMVTGLTSIVNKVIAAGMTPILATSNSQKTFEAMYEDWAANFYEPLINSLTPAFKVAGEPAFDYSNFYLLNKDVTNWWSADNVHPWMATLPNQAYAAAQIKKVAAPPALSAKEKFLFKFDNLGSYVGGFNTITGTGSQSLASVLNNRAVVVSGVSYGYTGASGVGNTVRANVGNYDVGISRLEPQGWYLYSTPGNMVHTFTGGAAYANRTGTARFTFNTSNSGRVSRFTIGASSADITGNTSGLQTASVPFTADGSGVVTITISPASGSYASVNAVELEFD